MSSSGQVLAVDGGNTKTIAVIAKASGQVSGVAQGGCTDVYGATNAGTAFAELARVVDLALSSASAPQASVEAAVFSLAGADWPEDYAYLYEFLGSSFTFGAQPVIVNDSIGGLRAGSEDWSGISIICGTGNAVGARRKDGRYFHLGFWPDTIGSPALSQQALDAVQRHSLGLGPATSLTERALETYGSAHPMQLLHWFTRRGGFGRSELVKMSPVLLDEADRGDSVAHKIVEDAGKGLGGQGRVCAERLGMEIVGTRVVLGGGIFEHPSNLLERRVMSQLPGAHAVRLKVPPIVGAVLAALDMINVAATPESVYESIKEWSSIPQSR